MSNLFQQILVVLVLLIVGTIIISVSTGENKAKKIIDFVKLKRIEKNKNTSDNDVEKEMNNDKTNATTVVRRKMPIKNGANGDTWYVLVRDKSNKHTIKKTTFTITGLMSEPFSIGRGQNVSLRISNNDFVSEEHAIVIYDDETESIIYVDNGSRNGSYVNSYYDEEHNYCEGEKIETAVIEEGVTIFLWDTPIIFSKTGNSGLNNLNQNSNKAESVVTKIYSK